MRRWRNAVMVTAVAAIACVAVAIAGSSAATSKAAAATTGPAITTGYAKGTAATAEMLLGVVDPNGQDTAYYFEYGLTANYGSATPKIDAGAGIINRPASAILSGLTAGTVYHYRLVAVNAGGTAFGGDETFTAGQTTSQIRVMGREGFVSPGRIIGVEVGCFNGQTICSGHIAMTHNGVLVGQRDYSIAPESGGFQNLQLTQAGAQLVRQNSVFNLLGVDVTVTDTTGQTLHYVIHLARWVWH